jgi:glycosyltransferase involved in cell wall biosynthesis
MKVLMITVLPPIKFAEADHAFHLCEHLADYGVEMHVIAQKGCVMPSHPRITVYPIMQKWSWVELPRLLRYTLRCSPDAIFLIYHGEIYQAHPMITFTPTFLRTFRPAVPFITLFEDACGSCASRTSLPSRALRKGLAQWLGPSDVDYGFGTLLRDSNRLIVVSDRSRGRLAECFSSVDSKSVLVPCPPIMRMISGDDGTARRLKRSALDLKEDEFLIAYFGRIYPFKGLETLLRAFQLVNGQRRPARLIMIGGYLGNPSYFHKMQTMSKELGLEDRVMWTGEYDWESDEASRSLRAADICVLPFDTGVCIHNSSLAGALAHGLPVITTQGIDMESVFIHKSNVFLCPPQNPDALAKAIETLIATPELRQRLSVGARELVEEWFSWEKAVQRTVEVLKGG